MPYAPHYLFVFRGSLGSSSTGADLWQFGIRTNNLGTAGGSAPSQGAVDKARAAFSSLLSAEAFSSAVTFEEVRGYLIGADGKSTLTPSRSSVTPVQKGASTTNLHPWSVSMAVTLDAGGARGGRFGRFYLPPMGIPVESSGRMTQARASGYAVALENFLTNAFGITGAENHVPVVASERFGTLRPVVRVRVGDVLDTQRRRDNRLNEFYGEAPYTP